LEQKLALPVAFIMGMSSMGAVLLDLVSHALRPRMGTGNGLVAVQEQLTRRGHGSETHHGGINGGNAIGTRRNVSINTRVIAIFIVSSMALAIGVVIAILQLATSAMLTASDTHESAVLAAPQWTGQLTVLTATTTQSTTTVLGGIVHGIQD
jgi:hypothetical protein